MNYSNWIFDLDGTITQPKHNFKSIKIELNIPIEDDILMFIDRQPSSIQKTLLKKLEDIEYQIVLQTEIQPHIKPFLEKLHHRKNNLGVITRNTKPHAIETLKRIQIDHLFDYDHIIGRNEFPAKPKPDAIVYFLNTWYAKPSTTCIVGDYKYDLMSGINAGIDTIHFNGHLGEKWPEYTTHYIESFTEILSKTSV